MMEWFWELTIEALGEKCVQVPHCSLYVPHAPSGAQTRPLAVTSQKLIAWAVARQFWFVCCWSYSTKRSVCQPGFVRQCCLERMWTVKLVPKWSTKSGRFNAWKCEVCVQLATAAQSWRWVGKGSALFWFCSSSNNLAAHYTCQPIAGHSPSSQPSTLFSFHNTNWNFQCLPTCTVASTMYYIDLTECVWYCSRTILHDGQRQRQYMYCMSQNLVHV